MLTYNGFYDSNLEFVGLEGVQIVASMNAQNSLGRHKLSTRFTSVVRVAAIGYDDHCASRHCAQPFAIRRQYCYTLRLLLELFSLHTILVLCFETYFNYTPYNAVLAIKTCSKSVNMLHTIDFM